MDLKSIKRVSDFFIFSHLLNGLAAASQVLLTYYILQISVNLNLVFTTGIATFLFYNFSLWLSIPQNVANSPFQRTKWFVRNKALMIAVAFVSLPFLIYSLYHLHIETLFLFLLCGGLSIGYLFPIIRFHRRRISLREVFGLKVFVIALVWTLLVAGEPVVEYLATGGEVNKNAVLFWLVLVFLFFVGITLPFDIRDRWQDRGYNLKTIPVLIGEGWSKTICYSLIVVHFVLLYLIPKGFIANPTGLIVLDFLIIVLFYRVLFRKKCDYNSVYLLDLALILQLLFVLL